MVSEGIDSNRVEQEVQNILDLGSVPMENFRTLILQKLDELEQFVDENKRKVLLATLTVGLGLMAAACEAPHTLQETNPDLHAQFVLSDYEQAKNAAEAQQEVGQDNQVAASVEQARQYQPNEFNVSWQFNATIQAGEGVVAALSRAAGTEAHEHTNVPEGFYQVVIIYHDGDPNGGPPEVYSWENLRQMNPTVYHGDRVVHTFLSQEGLQRLQRDFPDLAENTHVN